VLNATINNHLSALLN